MERNEKTQSFFKMNPEKIMKDFLLEKDMDFDEDKTNEIISEIETALKRNLLSSTVMRNFEMIKLKIAMFFLNSSCKKLIIEGNLDKSEFFALKSRQLFEKIILRLDDKHKSSWITLKISIYSNIATIYKKKKKMELALNLLKPFITDKKYDIANSSNFDPFFLGMENIYIIYAECLYLLNNFQESILYIEKAYDFLKMILENYEILHRNSMAVKDKKNYFTKYIEKKRNSIGFCFYLQGKIYERISNNMMALKSYSIACKISDEVLGPNEKTSIKYTRKLINLKKNLAFLNSLKEPIHFDKKEFKTNEHFFKPNTELFVKSTSAKSVKSTKFKSVLSQKRKNVIIPQLFKDEIPENFQEQHNNNHNSLPYKTNSKKEIRSNSNPLLFSFLTDRKRVSLQLPSDYFDIITKEILPQYRKNKISSDELRNIRIKTSSKGMCEYYSQKKFSKKHTFSNGSMKIKTLSINTPTAPSSSARGNLLFNETTMSSIKKMKFDLMKNQRPQSSTNLIFSKKKQTPRDDDSQNSMKNSMKITNKTKINKSYLNIETPKKISSKKSINFEKSRKSFRHISNNNINPIISPSNLHIDELLEIKSLVHIPTKKDISLFNNNNENIALTFKEKEDSKEPLQEIDPEESKIRKFLERRRKEKAKIKREQILLKKQQELLEKPKENVETINKIQKDISLTLIDDTYLGSITFIDDDLEEGKNKKNLVKKYQIIKLSFITFTFFWRRAFFHANCWIIQNVNIMHHLKKKFFILDIYVLINEKIVDLRLKIYTNKETEVFTQRNSWMILNFLLKIWIEEAHLDQEFAKYKENPKDSLIYIDKILFKARGEFDDFLVFVEILGFMFSLNFFMKRKINGTAWVFTNSEEIQQFSTHYKNLYEYNQRKRKNIKDVICRIDLIKSELYSILGYEKKIEHENYALEYEKFYKNFKIPLKNALFKRNSDLNKLFTLQKIPENPINIKKLKKDIKWNKKLESFENVLIYLEEEKNEEILNNKNNFSHEIEHSPFSKKLSKKSLNKKMSFESSLQISQSSSNFPSNKEFNCEIFDENSNNQKIHSLIINEKNMEKNNKNHQKLSMPNVLDVVRLSHLPIIRRNNTRKHRKEKTLAQKDLYMHEKPYKILIEEDVAEHYAGWPFYKNDVLFKSIKKVGPDYLLVYFSSEFEENSTKASDSFFLISSYILKSKRSIEERLPVKISLHDLYNKCFKAENHFFNLQSFLLKGGFNFIQKCLLVKNLNNLMNEKPFKSKFRKIILREEIIIFDLKNLNIFSLPCYENLKIYHTILDSSKNIIYSYTFTYLGRVYWRFSRSLNSNDKNFVISMYAPLSKITNYAIIKDIRLQEKVILLLKKAVCSSKKLKYSLISKYIYEKIDWVGKKLVFSEKRKETLKIKQRNITALNYQELKYSLLYKTIDVYIKTYFSKKKFYEAFYIAGIGKSYIKIKYFCSNHHIKTQNINMFLKFEILPQAKRNKLYKFIMSDCDIQLYLNQSLEFVNSREFLIFINKNILNKLELFKTNLYSKLKIPCFDVISQTNRFYFLENIFRPVQCEKKNLEQFLEKKCNIYKIIVQLTCKINKKFIIVTVKKNKILNNFHLSFYFQSSSRNFSSIFYMYELKHLDLIFLAKLLPYDFELLRMQKIANYLEFLENIKKIEILHKKQGSDIMKEFMANEGKLNDLYIEQFIWEKIVKTGRIVFSARNKMVFRINNYKGVLKEELFHTNILNSNENILFEITLNDPNSIINPFEIYEKISYKNCKNHKIFIKIFDLNTKITHCQAFTLRELTYSRLKVENEEKRKLYDVYLQQNEFKTLAFFWANLFHNIIIFPNMMNETIKYDEKYFDSDENLKKYKINVNKKLKLEEIEELLKAQNENFMIYKTILTTKPQQTFTLMYNPKEKNFIILIFIHSKCLKIKKTIEFSEFENMVPNLDYLISLRSFQYIGNFFFRKMKNLLIIKANLIFSEYY